MAGGRKQQILDVAATLVAERGFHGVSVHDIGTACGISGPALYRHYAGKDAILAAMLLDVSERLGTRAREQVAGAADARGALDALVAAHADFALTHPALIVVQEREWSQLRGADRDAVRALQLDYVDQWVAVVRSLRGDLDVRTARAAVQAVLGLLNSTPHSARIGDAAMRDLLTTMATAALLPG